MDTSCPKYDIQKIFSAYNPSRPNAYAQIKGGPLAPCIRGTIYLYQLGEGVYIKVYITGIPNVNNQASSFHGLHIHEVEIVLLVIIMSHLLLQNLIIIQVM